MSRLKYFILFSYIIQLLANKDSALFGHYKLRVLSMSTCNTFKPRNDSKIEFSVLGNGSVSYNFTIQKPVGPMQGRIRAYKWTNGKYALSLTYRQDNFCTFYFTLNILPFKIIADEKCMFQKQHHEGVEDKLDLVAHKFLGNNFFYGKFKFVCSWFSKSLTIMCGDVETEITPI